MLQIMKNTSRKCLTRHVSKPQTIESQSEASVAHEDTEQASDHVDHQDNAARCDSLIFSNSLSCRTNKRKRLAAPLRCETKQVFVCVIAAMFCPNTVSDGSICGGNSYSWSDRIQSTCANDERDKPLIGDKHRDEASAFSFFSSVDEDGDGMLEPPEVANFLRESIGGTAFDTQAEVETGVNKIMEKLDRNHDLGLDKSDVEAYWKHLESLLNADEVADWVVHAVQLPEYLGNIFRENMVTGYDFPELVENDGEAIRTELGIERSSFRKKIVRHIHARMLGIGSTPTIPSEIKHKLESCSTVNISWDRSTAEGFPVHSYRIKRRAVGLHDGDGPRKVITLDAGPGTHHMVNSPSNVQSLSLPLASDWATIYVGGESEFVDSGLELGHNYVYRVQAWNSVGRSAWATVDISDSLKKLKCSVKPNIKRSRPRIIDESNEGEPENWSLQTSYVGSIFYGVYFVMTFVITTIKGFLGLLGLAGALMRYKRGSASSTYLANPDPVFLSFFRFINTCSSRVLGVDLIPVSMLGDQKSKKDADIIHDRTIGAVGLNGYKQISRDNVNELSRHQKKIRSIDSKDDFHALDRRGKFGRRRSLSTGNLDQMEEIYKARSTVSSAKKSYNIMKRFRQKSADMSVSSRTTDTRPSSLNESSGDLSICTFIDTGTQRKREELSTFSQTKEGSIASEESESSRPSFYDDDDDYKSCNTCKKRYKFGKRWKHHCARCNETFCHKHGRTTHNHMTACKVPGTCVCNVCLGSDPYKSGGKNASKFQRKRSWN
mmetsp:Transcript_30485/g.45388  ORF Transcript_30485/g.45388 Transcript_30485/m.45388 type:complete len:775 (-) Transcript_30485:319-2643(-)